MTQRREPTARLTGLPSIRGSGLMRAQERQVLVLSSDMFKPHGALCGKNRNSMTKRREPTARLTGLPSHAWCGNDATTGKAGASVALVHAFPVRGLVRMSVLRSACVCVCACAQSSCRVYAPGDFFGRTHLCLRVVYQKSHMCVQTCEYGSTTWVLCVSIEPPARRTEWCIHTRPPGHTGATYTRALPVGQARKCLLRVSMALSGPMGTFAHMALPLGTPSRPPKATTSCH